MLYVQLALFPLLIVAGAPLARGLLKWRWGRWWWVGVAVPLGIIFLVILGHRMRRLAFVAPVSWTVDADLNPMLMTPVIATLFTLLIAKYPREKSRRAVTLMMGILLVYYGFAGTPAADGARRPAFHGDAPRRRGRASRPTGSRAGPPRRSPAWHGWECTRMNQPWPLRPGRAPPSAPMATSWRRQ